MKINYEFSFEAGEWDVNVYEFEYEVPIGFDDVAAYLMPENPHAKDARLGTSGARACKDAFDEGARAAIERVLKDLNFLQSIVDELEFDGDFREFMENRYHDKALKEFNEGYEG